jgi:hypothetical protein
MEVMVSAILTLLRKPDPTPVVQPATLPGAIAALAIRP